ncbi:MAG: fumarylacetoacetate hydrolase family protein [Deltaproteobacteria bacterium]|nr:fumarylacetoacetate hydrolase family protein [Deltaproteobacteria bacterium]
MKIAQFYDHHQIRLGLIEGESLVPLDFHGDMIDFITNHPEYATTAESIPLEHVHFAPVVSRPSKIIALGLNYMDHVIESKGRVPGTPLIFAKFPNSLIGHGEPIIWDDAVTKKVDFEAELAVVMGQKTVHCHESDAMQMIFGYTCANDVSARDLQFGDKQWVRGKSLDTFCPLGPWIVPGNEIPDPHELAITCRLNGMTMQAGNTNQMIFKLPQLISFLSNHFTLMPGDVILTGTPSGVGAFRDPSIYMKHGDEIIVEIEHIGRLINNCLIMKY